MSELIGGVKFEQISNFCYFEVKFGVCRTEFLSAAKFFNLTRRDEIFKEICLDLENFGTF